MGQMVSVVEKRSSTPGIVRFEANRVLTGQGHERFASAADAVGPRPAAARARRRFATGRQGGTPASALFVEEAPAEVASSGGGDAGAGGPSEYERRVPEVLRERSKAALAKWKAANG